jgi:hypothetical protein
MLSLSRLHTYLLRHLTTEEAEDDFVHLAQSQPGYGVELFPCVTADGKVGW